MGDSSGQSLKEMSLAKKTGQILPPGGQGSSRLFWERGICIFCSPRLSDLRSVLKPLRVLLWQVRRWQEAWVLALRPPVQRVQMVLT